jgi:acetyl esterase/lipase
MQQAFATETTNEQKAAFSFGALFNAYKDDEVAFKTYTYYRDGNTHLALDFYPARTEVPAPCVVVVHGGSWSGGDSRQLPELNHRLALKGFHVAAINYRKAPAHKSPAAVEDVFLSLSYLMANAVRLKIDTGNIVLLGRSAGAQIALLAAYTAPPKSIKGVISFYGPADMVWGYSLPANPLVMDSRKVMSDYLGGSYEDVPDQYASSSATLAVSADAPPTLMIHGQNDPLVAYEHNTRLIDELKRHGVPYYLLTLPWATHGFDYTLHGPGGQLSTYAVEEFLQIVTMSKSK